MKNKKEFLVGGLSKMHRLAGIQTEGIKEVEPVEEKAPIKETFEPVKEIVFFTNNCPEINLSRFYLKDESRKIYTFKSSFIETTLHSLEGKDNETDIFWNQKTDVWNNDRDSLYLFDSEDSMIRVDMSEYMEKISVNRIIGSPSGYIGYDDTNLLDKIRRKPYCVILLDEIEKAHQDVYNIFLQAFDDGHMTDSHGREVSFKNAVILMTSNVGTRIVKDFGNGVGFTTKSKEESKSEDAKSTLEKELNKI